MDKDGPGKTSKQQLLGCKIRMLELHKMLHRIIVTGEIEDLTLLTSNVTLSEGMMGFTLQCYLYLNRK